MKSQTAFDLLDVGEFRGKKVQAFILPSEDTFNYMSIIFEDGTSFNIEGENLRIERVKTIHHKENE